MATVIIGWRWGIVIGLVQIKFLYIKIFQAKWAVVFRWSAITSNRRFQCFVFAGLEASRLYEQRTILRSRNRLRGSALATKLEQPRGRAGNESDGTSKNSGIYTRDINRKQQTRRLISGTTQPKYLPKFSDMMDGLVSGRQNNRMVAVCFVGDRVWTTSSITEHNIGTAIFSHRRFCKLWSNRQKQEKWQSSRIQTADFLAKALLKKLEDDKVAGKNNLIDDIDTVILVATPQVGTALAFPAMLHGFDQTTWTDRTAAESADCSRTWSEHADVIRLASSRDYINHISASPVTLTHFTDKCNGSICQCFMQSYRLIQRIHKFSFWKRR